MCVCVCVCKYVYTIPGLRLAGWGLLKRGHPAGKEEEEEDEKKEEEGNPQTIGETAGCG